MRYHDFSRCGPALKTERQSCWPLRDKKLNKQDVEMVLICYTYS